MDGISVNEAAAVLGIPEGRVWELLARGVLSGSTEVGGDMRVFLRGTAVPEPVQQKGNGNGGNGGSGELTPFRELLTEFRNLTERYGQALLALGEARGEVASLRGRVDLLEARLDNRSPWPSAAAATWADASPAALTPEQEPPPERTAQHAVAPAGDLARNGPPVAPDIEEPAPETEEASDVVADVLDATIGPAVAAIEEPAAEPEPEATAAMDEPEPEPESAAVAPATEEDVTAEAAPIEVPPMAAPMAAAVATAAAARSDESTTRPRPTPRGPAREAFSGFAAALERAQDPTTEAVAAEFEELPGSRETAEALAAYRRDLEVEPIPPPAVDEVRPIEVEAEVESTQPIPELVPEARPEPVMEAVAEPPAQPEIEPASVSPRQPGYTTDTPEPDWIAEEDLVISAGDDPSVRAGALVREAVMVKATSVPVMAAAPEESEPEAVEAAPEPEPIVLPEPEPVIVAEAEPEPIVLPEPEPVIVAEAWPEVDVAESRLTPVEIAAEPPAADDAPLLTDPPPFVEPPILPREPAFWESGAGSRAPFAIARPEEWHPDLPEPVSVDIQDSGTPPTTTDVPTAPRRPTLEPEPSLEPRPLSPAAAAGRAAAARRQPRGPAARALRRLRYLLD